VIVYEVNLQVDREIADAYRAWLRPHIAEIVALPGFFGAELFEVLEPAADGRLSLCVQYRLRDVDALQAYLDQHAARMRGEGLAKFGGRFSAQRRVLAGA
jgi:antibiotic biosynthesis monooxygenase (ABM) superfamily enzyme